MKIAVIRLQPRTHNILKELLAANVESRWELLKAWKRNNECKFADIIIEVIILDYRFILTFFFSFITLLLGMDP